jgi:hypothetical protein
MRSMPILCVWLAVGTLPQTSECAKDDRAWPYLRGEDEKIEMPHCEKMESIHLLPAYDPAKRTTIENYPHDDFTTYMGDLDLAALQ